jgi:hypothetical protein
MVTKYTAEDVGKQIFVIEKFYQWKMMDNKDIKIQINEYYRLLDDMKAKNINLSKGLVVEILIEKLTNS